MTSHVEDTFATTPPLDSSQPPHHMENVVTIDDVTFINDSKAVSAESAAEALGAFDPVYWIVGGQADVGNISILASYLTKIRHSFLIGEAAPQIASWLDEHGAPYTITETLQRAVQAAAHMAWDEDLENATVLLAPACAPDDQFPNFEARGDLFRNAVNALKVESAG